MKPVITFNVDQAADYGYHRLQVHIKTSYRTSLADRLQQLFDNPDEVCSESGREPVTAAVKTLCRRGYTDVFDAAFENDDVVIDWLEYKGRETDYCDPNFKMETRHPQAFRKIHGWLSRIARSVAKARNRSFEPDFFANLFRNPTAVLKTLRRLPSFIETEHVDIDGITFIVDKINPAVDQEQS